MGKEGEGPGDTQPEKYHSPDPFSSARGLPFTTHQTVEDGPLDRLLSQLVVGQHLAEPPAAGQIHGTLVALGDPALQQQQGDKASGFVLMDY